MNIMLTIMLVTMFVMMIATIITAVGDLIVEWQNNYTLLDAMDEYNSLLDDEVQS